MPSWSVDLRDASAVVQLLADAATAMRSSPYRRHSVERLPARGRLLVTGDLHDNVIHLSKVLALADLPESADHHVVLHELIHGDMLINGMDFSHRMLARVAEMVVRHPGQVHPLLANHELSQMTGRGVSKGAGNSVVLFDEALEFVYGSQWGEVEEAIKAFVAAMPIALLSDSGLLCAHSLPNDLKRFDLDLFDRDLCDEDYRGPVGSAYLMVWGRLYDDQLVETLAQRWGVELFCLGHEHVEMGIELRGQRVIVLNTDHERATVLRVDLAALPSPEEALMSAIPLIAVREPTSE